MRRRAALHAGRAPIAWGRSASLRPGGQKALTSVVTPRVREGKGHANGPPRGRCMVPVWSRLAVIHSDVVCLQYPAC
jgi:hypothetical protein